jgi:hypothetical protein
MATRLPAPVLLAACVFASSLLHLTRMLVAKKAKAINQVAGYAAQVRVRWLNVRLNRERLKGI